jgi:hypothetical protein
MSAAENGKSDRQKSDRHQQQCALKAKTSQGTCRLGAHGPHAVCLSGHAVTAYNNEAGWKLSVDVTHEDG